MTRDFASRSQRRFPVIPVLAGIAIGCGLALLATVLFTPLPENEQRLLRNPGEATPTPEPTTVAAVRNAQPTMPPAEPARFKFYELLPNLEVIPFVDPTPTAAPQRGSREATARSEAPARGDSTARANTPPPRTPAADERYWVQAGSFRSADDADARRAELILLGLQARVESVSIPGKGRFHRVKIGPQPDTAAAREVMQRLAREGIDSYFTREKS